jgi:hypothetical protein
MEPGGTDAGVYAENLPAPAVRAPSSTTTLLPGDDELSGEDDDQGSLLDRLFPRQDDENPLPTPGRRTND